MKKSTRYVIGVFLDLRKALDVVQHEILPGAGADPSRPEPESAPGPWPSGAGAAQNSGGSATLVPVYYKVH